MWAILANFLLVPFVLSPLVSEPIPDRNEYLAFLEDYYNVEIEDGHFDTPHGQVSYRMCYSRTIEEGWQYPSSLLAPGLKIRLDYWALDCARIADAGYVMFMKGREGHNFTELETEVERAIQTMREFDFIDDDRIAAIASSFGNQEIQSYGVDHAEDLKAYVAISTYNNPFVMRNSLANFDIPTLLLSGGGEEPPLQRSCDHDAFVWSGEFASKLEYENPEYYLGWKAFDMETYGCVQHGYMWDFGSPAEEESIQHILRVLDDFLEREPVAN